MNAHPVIAVTGASGYVGDLIAKSLQPGATVLGLVRRPATAEQIRWSFGCDREALARELRARGVTGLVHAAWDMSESSLGALERGCVAGSRDLLAAAHEAGVGRLVFISTISAFDGAKSAYGRAKLEVERAFLEAGGTVFRLGLVYGDPPGGAFATIDRAARKGRIAPLIGDGAAPQYLVDAATVGAVAARALHGDFDGERQPITVASPEPIAFRELLRAIAASHGRRPILAPIPWRLLYFALLTAERAGLRVGVKSDSILSFVHQDPAPDFEPMRRLGILPEPFRARAGA
ncbi:MAG TPA: NAD-dependent epimerase/dehydratase family protein [Methylocystis sp.]|nr:NAD-dependent epimerase/dehydratase family protein [Methylocystis sp.]